MKKIIIYGSGGHGKVVADAAEKAGLLVEGWLDNTKPVNTVVFGYTVLGADVDASELVHSDTRAVVIAIGDNADRKRLVDFLSNFGAQFASVVHPSAIMASGVKILEGVVICANAVINADAIIGKQVIVNTGAIIEHDCRVGDFTHIASHTTLSGGSSVGDFTLIGTNATVLPKIKIGNYCIVGAGAVVTRDVSSHTTVVGNPARPLVK